MRRLDQARDLTFVIMNCLDNSHDHRGHGPLTSGQGSRARPAKFEEPAKRDFGAHLIAYLSVNAMLVGIWYVTGAAFFWPIFIIMGWGIGIAFNAWDVFSAPPGPDRVAEEMERLRHR